MRVYFYNWRPYVKLAFVQNILSSWNKVIIIITFERASSYPFLAETARKHQPLAFMPNMLSSWNKVIIIIISS